MVTPTICTSKNLAFVVTRWGLGHGQLAQIRTQGQERVSLLQPISPTGYNEKQGKIKKTTLWEFWRAYKSRHIKEESQNWKKQLYEDGLVWFCFPLSFPGFDLMVVQVAKMYNWHRQQKFHDKTLFVYLFVYPGQRTRKRATASEEGGCNAHFFFFHLFHGLPNGSPCNRTAQWQWRQLKLWEKPHFSGQRNQEERCPCSKECVCMCMCVCVHGGLSVNFFLYFFCCCFVLRVAIVTLHCMLAVGTAKILSETSFFLPELLGKKLLRSRNVSIILEVQRDMP